MDKNLHGKEMEQILQDLDHPYISGLSLLGGEPLEQINQQGLLPLLRKVKERFPEKDIWCYTGYTFDEQVMGEMCHKWKETPEFLSYLDVMVDGEFEEENKDLSLRFKGSTNQRMIDVKKSLQEKKTVLFEC